MLFMIGFPWENETLVKQTMDFAKELGGDFADFNVAYPYPGTEMYEICKEEGLFNEDKLCGHDISRSMLKTKYLSTERLNKLRKKAILNFYLRPGYFLHTLKSIKSPKMMLNYMKKGSELIFKLSKK